MVEELASEPLRWLSHFTQFLRRQKCCSMAVPSVITRFPPIKRVSMKRLRLGPKTDCATSHAIHWKRKDDIAESLPTIILSHKLALMRLGSIIQDTLKIGQNRQRATQCSWQQIKKSQWKRICLGPLPIKVKIHLPAVLSKNADKA